QSSFGGHVLSIPRAHTRESLRSGGVHGALHICVSNCRLADLRIVAESGSGYAGGHVHDCAYGLAFRVHFSARDDATAFAVAGIDHPAHLLPADCSRHHSSRCRAPGLVDMACTAGSYGCGHAVPEHKKIQGDLLVIARLYSGGNSWLGKMSKCSKSIM